MQIEIDDFVGKTKRIGESFIKGEVELSETQIQLLHTCLNYITDNCGNYSCVCSSSLIKELKRIKSLIKLKLNGSPPDFMTLSRKKLVNDLEGLFLFCFTKEFSEN